MAAASAASLPALLALWVGGCGVASSPDDASAPVDLGGAAVDLASPTVGRDAASPRDGAVTSPGWELTVYYTAVESFHHGAPQAITGCTSMDCAHGTVALGAWPADFIAAVMSEGAGRITSTPAGKYLNWASDTGFWLDSAPRDARGEALRPFVSCAHQSAPFFTPIAIVACGVDSATMQPIDAGACARLRGAAWQVLDRFGPGFGGARHLDLYIGEEDRADFENQSPLVITTRAAVVAEGP
jgi:hypothetical protein